MTMPKISIIIPLYNKEKIVQRSVNSVLCQSFSDFELIIVDDGSTDNSLSVVKSIKDKRIHIIEQENGGPSKARNTGVKHAKGEWILFLDADDELLDGALERYVETLKSKSDVNMIACPFLVFDGKEDRVMYLYSEGYLSYPIKATFFENFLPRTGAFLYKKELAIKNLFNEGIRRFEDLEMLLRLYKNANIYLLSKPSVKVNITFASASVGRKNIEEDFLGHLDFRGKSFWEFMCLYQFYLSERPHYKGQVEKLYPTLKYRYDLLLLYKLLRLFK